MSQAAREPYGVLFLCTGNSARSILAEAILRQQCGERFRAFSAGSHPKPEPHPLALETLREMGHEPVGLRSKSWEEFAGPDAPPIHFVFTVCDNAAGETCPAWPGRPLTAHWGVEDPAAAEGDETQRRDAFRKAYAELEARIERFTRLPVERLDPLRDRRELQEELDAIGARD